MQNSGLFQYSIGDLIQIKNNFVSELIYSKSENKTSLEFIKTTLPPKQDITNFQVLVVGGTHYTSSLVVNSRLQTSSIEVGEVPKFSNKFVFSNFILERILTDTKTLVINFAFPIEPKLSEFSLDGKLLFAGKDHAFDGLDDQLIGHFLEVEYAKKTGKKININIINDTACLVLSGLKISKPDNLVGGVIGSGINFGFFLENNLIVNLEAAGFSKFNVSDTTKIIDKTAVEPGEALFEIETAGAYLFKHYNLINSSNLSSTEKLSQLAANGDDLAQKLFLRSASLAACQIAGIYEFKQQPKLTFVMEGSLFWQGWQYKQTIEEYIQKLGVPDSGIEFVQIENSGLIGAAHLLI